MRPRVRGDGEECFSYAVAVCPNTHEITEHIPRIFEHADVGFTFLAKGDGAIM